MSDAKFEQALDCQTIVFLVGDALFRVPLEIFASSPVFMDMLVMPQPSGAQEGSSPQYPLRLDGVDKEDFHNFLRLFLPVRSPYFTAHPPPELGRDVWVSVLHLASLWQMAAARDEAIQHLSVLVADPSERLALADKHDVGAWVVPALAELVHRAAPIRADDVGRIGLARMLKVVELREQRLAGSGTDGEWTHDTPYPLVGGFQNRRKSNVSHLIGPPSSSQMLAQPMAKLAVSQFFTEEEIKAAFGL